MKSVRSLAVVMFAFLAGPVVNHVAGATVQNMECAPGPCAALSQKCFIAGTPCTWCNDGGWVNMCVPRYYHVCHSTGELTCEHEYSGTCVDTYPHGGMVCTGSTYVGKDCVKPRCLFIPLPP